jgi:protein-disulfide isomerase
MAHRPCFVKPVSYNANMRFLFAAALCLLPLAAADAPKSALDKPTLEAYVRHLLAISPEVQVKIDDPKPAGVADMRQVDVHFTLGPRSQDDTFYISKDGKKLIRGVIYDIGQNPFQPELEKLKTDLSPSYGTPGAPVVLVVFSDFECPNCKEEAKVLRQDLPKMFPTQIRVYFKDFPLEAIHPWAKAAAMAGRCVYRQNANEFWKYHDWMFEHQGEITAENLKTQVLEFAKSTELDAMQLGRCIDTKATEAEVDKTLAEGRSLKIEATPTTFLNGRRLVGNYPLQNLQQLVDAELKYQTAAKDAGEKCCEVSIPSPLKK